jgi:hypothetical protein
MALSGEELAEILQDDITLTPAYVSREKAALLERNGGCKSKGKAKKIVEELQRLLARLQTLLGLGTHLPNFKQTSLKALEDDNILWDNPNETSLGAPSNPEGSPTGAKLVDTNTEMSVSAEEAAAIEKMIKNTAKEAKAKGLWSCPFAVQVASSLVRLLVSKDAIVRELAASSLSEYVFLCF